MPTNVPIVRQAFDYSCGAACLASCLYYWGVWDGREPELYQLLDTDIDGTSGHSIMEVAQSFGLEVVYRNNLGMGDLKAYLDMGYTAILNIQAWGQFDSTTDFGEVWEDGHYVVLVNLLNTEVLMMDPSVAGRYAIMSKTEFEARWHDWSDEGDSKEYHTAILLKGKRAIDLTQPYYITCGANDRVINDA